MELNRFITLQTVVEEGSFVRAAHKLCCTQSTITFHIRQLEQELSIQLFEKIGRRMVLTEAGKTVLPMARELTQTMDNIRRALQPDDLGGELRLVAGESLLAYRLLGTLKRFRSRAPHVRLFLQALNCYTIKDVLMAGEADLGVFYHVGDEPSLKMEAMATFPLVLVASPQIFMQCADVDFMRHDQRLPISLIINESQCAYRLLFERSLRQRNIVLGNVIELWSIESIKQCVVANLGVSYLPRFCVEKELQTGVLQELPFHPGGESVIALCAHHVNKCLSPAAQLFMQLLREEMLLNSSNS